MADSLSMALQDLLRKAEAEPDLDTLREGVRVMTQALMEIEVAQHLGAERYQRTTDRQGERNGFRDRRWDTRVGTLDLRVPIHPPGVACRGSVTAASSPPSWSRANVPNGR